VRVTGVEVVHRHPFEPGAEVCLDLCVFRRKSAADSDMKSATDSDLISAIPI
jgi:hypothetical protein